MIGTTEWTDAPAGTSGQSLFAVGDVHGRADLLAEMHEALRSLLDGDSGLRQQALVVHLGDLIDRGPAGVQALRMALDWSHQRAEAAVLPGNHEQMLCAMLATEDEEEADRLGGLWLMNGGMAMLTEAGGAATSIGGVQEAMRAAIGPERLRLLARSPVGIRDGRWLLVHAGVPVGSQPDDIPGMRWSEVPAAWEGHLCPLWVREAGVTHENPFHEAAAWVKPSPF